MKRFKIAVAIAGWVMAAVAIGMTATAWASSGSSGTDAVGQQPPVTTGLPHAPRPPAQTESVYVPITPCRLLSTVVAGSMLANGTTRSYYVGGKFGFSSQGGKNGGCGIPIGATAISANIAATQADAHGYVRAYPANLAEPTATVLTYRASTLSASTGATISIEKNSALALKITNHGGPTNVIVDVSGYYAQQMDGMITNTGAVYAGSNRILSATKVSTGRYEVTFDTDVSDCTPMVNPYQGFGVYASAYAFDGPVVTVYTWSINPTTHVEAAKDSYFYINVTC